MVKRKGEQKYVVMIEWFFVDDSGVYVRAITPLYKKCKWNRAGLDLF